MRASRSICSGSISASIFKSPALKLPGIGRLGLSPAPGAA